MRRLAYLFVPANSEKMIEKGIHSKADAIIFDLEDAVAHEEKQRARDRLVNKLGSHRAEHFFVRINDLASEFWEADVEAIDQLPEYRLVIPKVTCAKDINIVEQRQRTVLKFCQSLKVPKACGMSWRSPRPRLK
ncbi:L-malyl-CoA/beta-methylmalyl-CoA lyase [Geomicrobium sp. JCM 19037]|uniref:aldolase/citrate lyase family protein n=1 Tax=Geomicrobium sp. JCM 19037 TaxID=1460634 RepID=UPI00045F1B18|nr:aldolase/citrate lyase family protein [Geomicrobium sp. JCM 19037]GAK04324.1 L-malyl-CoA/beta-methylmalyl-CoA lyase [Geomicrobium sp. JCM 19037]